VIRGKGREEMGGIREREEEGKGKEEANGGRRKKLDEPVPQPLNRGGAPVIAIDIITCDLL
jgi:hypothetical protein